MKEYSLRRGHKDYKVIVKRVEFTQKELLNVLLTEKSVKKRLLENGFDLSKRYEKREKRENYGGLVVVYEQKKYIIPKAKRYEEA